MRNRYYAGLPASHPSIGYTIPSPPINAPATHNARWIFMVMVETEIDHNLQIAIKAALRQQIYSSQRESS